MRAQDGHVRIRHVWQRYEPDALVTEFDLPLEIGRKDELRRLSYEASSLGFFRWRVWSRKENLTRGHWRVDVVYDGSYEPVLCTDAAGRRPCSYALEVQ